MMKPLEITTPSDTELRILREVDAPQDLVWDTWTQPALVARWMLGPPGWTMPVCEMDLRVGGAWRYVWRKNHGEEMEMTGKYLEVTPTSRLVSTERWRPQRPETNNEVELVEKDGRTTIIQTVQYPSKEARDAATRTGMAEGLEQSYQRIDALLASLRAGGTAAAGA